MVIGQKKHKALLHRLSFPHGWSVSIPLLGKVLLPVLHCTDPICGSSPCQNVWHTQIGLYRPWPELRCQKWPLSTPVIGESAVVFGVILFTFNETEQLRKETAYELTSGALSSTWECMCVYFRNTVVPMGISSAGILGTTVKIRRLIIKRWSENNSKQPFFSVFQSIPLHPQLIRMALLTRLKKEHKQPDDDQAEAVVKKKEPDANIMPPGKWNQHSTGLLVYLNLASLST